MKLDKINCKILDMLQEDCRMSYTDISKKVNLSVDSVKKRVNKMIKENVFFPKIQMRARNIGFKNVISISIMLHNYTTKDLEEFINYMKQNSRVIELLKLSGEWDFLAVIIAKDPFDQAKQTEVIRNKFHKIIKTWSESLTISAYKFEKYDMLNLYDDMRE